MIGLKNASVLREYLDPKVLYSINKLVSGHNPLVINRYVEQAMLLGLASSECKIMLSNEDGSYEERFVADGFSVPSDLGTRCFMNLELAEALLPALLVPPEISLDFIDRVNAYITPVRKGVPLHFDSRAVIIVQLVGEKCWQISKEPAVKVPTRNFVAPKQVKFFEYEGIMLSAPNEDAFNYTFLRPGDWLVVPRGAWHATFSLTGSISVTLAIKDY